MEIIKESNSLIKDILNTNSHSNKDKRLHNFCLSFNTNEEEIIYNGITGETIRVNKKRTQDDENYLKSHHYYLDNEYSVVDEIRNKIYKARENNTIDNYTILTTGDCNARCYYCYQKNIDKTYMSIGTANNVSNFIINNSKNDVKLNWFGGEPLLNDKAIDIITNNLKENNINYVSNIITNGYLFNEENINKYKDLWHLNNIQITLDGTKQIYNNIKKYINDSNGFDKVINNIRTLINNECKVSIRLHLTKNNYDDLNELIDYLYKEFGNNKYFKAYVSLLFQDETKDNLDLYKNKLALQRKLHKLGIFDNKINLNLKTVYCIGDNPNAVVIEPNGDLKSCEHVKKDNSYSNIQKSEFSKPYSYWHELDDVKEDCYKCSLYPACISLKHCPANSHLCNEYIRKEKLEKIKWKIEELAKKEIK